MFRVRIEAHVPVLLYGDFRQFEGRRHQSNAFHLRKRHGGGRGNRNNQIGFLHDEWNARKVRRVQNYLSLHSSSCEQLLKHFPTPPFRVHNGVLCGKELSESHPLAFDAVMSAYEASKVMTEEPLLNMRVPFQVRKIANCQIHLAGFQGLLHVAGSEA
jgi:hypothetical protein